MASSPLFTLLPAGLDDIPSTVDVYEAAFVNIYFSSLYFPPSTVPDASKRRWLAERFSSQVPVPHKRHFKVIETASGKMAGWARWEVPHELSEQEIGEMKEAEDKKAKGIKIPSVLPEGGVPELFDIKFDLLHEMQDKYVEPGSAYSKSSSSLPFCIDSWWEADL